jgi:pimeloyl-ACP methyl ester carboxylesterase
MPDDATTANEIPTPADEPTTSHPDQWWTPRGVRLTRARANPGGWNWLFFPGGPGIGGESLAELVTTIDVPGTSWLVDLPGDGSNVDAPGAPTDPYPIWPGVLLEAVEALPNSVAVGHSTGGEYLLSVPALKDQLAGLVLVSTAPDCRWMPTFEAMCAADPIADVAAATERFEREPNNSTLGDLAVATAPWNFTPAALPAGRELLARMPYNRDAVEWSDQNFDRTYVAAWWPEAVPTLIVSGERDRIVDQRLWHDPNYVGDNVTRVEITDAGHFAWIDQPVQVHRAFADFVGRL